MSIAHFTRTVLRLQYHLGRLPVQFVEERVLAGMDAEAPVRQQYERALGTLHVAVGQVLCDPKLQQRGDALRQRGVASA
jgi:hypothetical protein